MQRWPNGWRSHRRMAKTHQDDSLQTPGATHKPSLNKNMQGLYGEDRGSFLKAPKKNP